MGAPGCMSCATRPVMRCGRCNTTCCEAHALAPGERCDRCERDWQDDGVIRSAAKVIFAPPLAIFAGGLLFALLLPISLGGVVGAAVMCAIACALAFATGAGVCRLVDHSARAMFLREHTAGLPPARLLPAPRSGPR